MARRKRKKYRRDATPGQIGQWAARQDDYVRGILREAINFLAASEQELSAFRESDLSAAHGRIVGKSMNQMKRIYRELLKVAKYYGIS